jgi:hypothetical protein
VTSAINVVVHPARSGEAWWLSHAQPGRITTTCATTMTGPSLARTARRHGADVHDSHHGPSLSSRDEKKNGGERNTTERAFVIVRFLGNNAWTFDLTTRIHVAVLSSYRIRFGERKARCRCCWAFPVMC